MDRARTLAALSLASLTMSETAAAQELGRFRYAWVRDEGADRCPDGPTIAREVARRLGRDPFVTVSGAPSVEAVVRRDDGTWLARLIVRDADGALVGTREFTNAATDCTAIASAVTLGIALAIDPEAALRPPAATPAPTPVPVETAPVRAIPPAPSPWWRRAGVSAGATLAVGLLPNVGVGVQLGAEGGPLSWLRVGGGARFFPESTTVTTVGNYSFGLTTAWLSACWEPLRGSVATFGLCARVEAGALQATVTQGIPSRAGAQAWGAASVGGRSRLHVAGPVSVELGAEALFPFARHDFFFRPAMPPTVTVFQQSVVVFVGFVGVALQFR